MNLNINLGFNYVEHLEHSKEKMKTAQKRKQAFEKKPKTTEPVYRLDKLALLHDIKQETIITIVFQNEQFILQMPLTNRMYTVAKSDMPVIKAYIEDPSLEKICHDTRTVAMNMHEMDIKLNGVVHDTRLAEHLLDENRLSENNDIHSLYLTQSEKLKQDEKLERYYKKIEMPLIPILLDMEKTGIHVSEQCRETIITKHMKNGKIHPKYSQTSTVTGRLSSFEPNIQGLEKSIRHHLVAPNGQVFLSSDLKSQEPRFLAHFSKEPKLIEAMKSGRDIYSVLAADLYKKPYHSVLDGTKERATAKVILLAMIYGISINGICKQTGLSVLEAEQLVQTFYSKYPNIATWKSTVLEFCRTHQYVEIIGGRKRRIPEINSSDNKKRSKAERQAINSIIQGSSAVQTKVSLLKLNAFCQDKPYKIIASIHDEIVMTVPETITTEEVHEIEQIITRAVNITVPFECETVLMKQWGIPII